MFPLRDDRPTDTAPIVTTLLIVACALVFFHELQIGEEFNLNAFIDKYALIPAHMRPQTLVTSMYLHGGWFHIIGNMVFLWAFGKSLEDAMGHSKFLAFYTICGVAAGLAQVVLNRYSPLPIIGASGAIAGVMGAYLVKFPRTKIHTLVFLVFFVFITDVPAAFILVYWFLIQLSSEYSSITQMQVGNGGVAYAAHIGGFVTGMILIQFMGVRTRYFPRRDIYW